jgi:hypothetical protein
MAAGASFVEIAVFLSLMEQVYRHSQLVVQVHCMQTLAATDVCKLLPTHHLKKFALR